MTSLNLATQEGLQQYLEAAPLDELQDIATRLSIKFDELPGETTSDKARELIAYVDRRRQLPELVLAAMHTHITSQLSSDESNNSDQYSKTIASNNGLKSLSLQINSLQEQVQEIRRSPTENKGLENKLNELAKTAETANRLTASVVLPSAESMAVHLAPIYKLDRLQEHQSDENWAFLLIGAFAGAILGIITNWANNENFELTKFSIVLMAIFGVLLLITLLWTVRLRKRTKTIISEIISNAKPSFEPIKREDIALE